MNDIWYLAGFCCAMPGQGFCFVNSMRTVWFGTNRPMFWLDGGYT